MRRAVAWMIVGACLASMNVGAEIRAGHPRLILLEDRASALREDVKNDPVLNAWYASVRESAEALLNMPVNGYRFEDRAIMLGACRESVERVYSLGLVYRIEGDKRFARRGIDELMRATQLPSWNPAHFLDTAELTHAMAIGYDWFYDAFAPEERETVREAICTKGLKEGLYFLEDPHPFLWKSKDFNWALCSFNWNQVCNGGMTIGALAVADEAPDIASRVLKTSLPSIRRAMKQYGPDGGWVEGPGYWGYATYYNVCFLAALETAMGPDAIAPYLSIPGFEKTGEFCIRTVGPLGKTFNFADSGEDMWRDSQMFWLARTFHSPVCAWYAAQHAKPNPLDIIWYDPNQKSPDACGLALDAYYRHVEAAFFRSAWEDRNAVFVGFKGGGNFYNHAHADLGTFVLDADGERWALDLGRDNYALPGYFYVGRVAYYRLKTEGHNTLLIDGRNQRIAASAPITAFRSTPERAFAVADLSDGYSLPQGSVRRGMMLIDRRNVLMQDEFSFAESTPVTWQMHTRAEIVLDGAKATLRQGGKTLAAQIIEPAGATFESLPADAPPPQGQQPDVHKLTIHVNAPAGASRVVVVLSPGEVATPAALRPLAEW